MISGYDPLTSGIWKPIIIKRTESTLEYGDLLAKPKTEMQVNIDPCNCNPTAFTDINIMAQNAAINCDYCSPMSPASYYGISKLIDTDGNEYSPGDTSSPLTSIAYCCDGGCDTKMLPDDYLPKIPFLYQKYITSFEDFKYKKQFPAITNAGLGFHKFITAETSNMDSFDANGPQLVIDWDIKDRISEIAYDPATSEYDNEIDHNKAYSRSLHTSSTCGNFILTSLNTTYSSGYPYYSIFSGLIGDTVTTNISNDIGSLLPSIENFKNIPHSFSKNNYDNIFIKTEKIGSHWKWNYSSGILCWYRYHNIGIPTDQDPRPIPQVDLYIPPGDVFYVTNDGPEPGSVPSEDLDANNGDIKNCPSGIKLLKGGQVKGIIPSGSSFTYISANLYDTFWDIHSRIIKADSALSSSERMTPIQRFQLATLLSTAPQYDNYTVDLLKRNNTYQYAINNYKQIDLFDKNMTTSKIGSVNSLYYIKNKSDLINTLANKYGSYILFPPNSSAELTLTQEIKNACYVDLDFDMVIKPTDTFNIAACNRMIDCSSPIPVKKFVYGQKVSIGSTIAAETIVDNDTIVYDKVCKNNAMVVDKNKITKMAHLLINGDYHQTIPFSSGCMIFQDNYPRIIQSNTTGYCYNCTSSDYSRFSTQNTADANPPDGAESSSYKLFITKVLNNSEDLCWYYQNEDSFCDYNLGRYYNNNELGGVYGNRPLRAIKDSTVYFKRTYNATALNPRLNTVAFHAQGGIYYDSKIFGGTNGSTVFTSQTSIPEEKLKIKFNTKDTAIKLYNINIQKLRSKDDPSCLAFPNKNSCKCFPMIRMPEYPFACGSTSSSVTYTNSASYTPALSTTYGPNILSYGGYISSEVAAKLKLDSSTDLSAIGIPGHPLPGNILSTVNKKIDPLNPYGCQIENTITLFNYVYTIWPIQLPNYSTHHADVWASVIENVDLFRAINFTEIFNDETGEYEEAIIPNQGYQRFASSVYMNGTSVYDRQSKVIAANGASLTTTFDVEITNPFLAKLLNSTPILYPGTGYLCAGKTIYGPRGDESVNLSIKFSRIPRKQILNFAIKAPLPLGMGVLKRGFFHPNSGIIIGAQTTETPIVKNDNRLFIDYDRYLFEDNEENRDTFSSEGSVLIGYMNPATKLVLNQIDSFERNKKLKLYLYINGQWHEYAPDHSFGFGKDNKTYIGHPFMFDYSENDKISNISGPIVPTSAKKHLPFNFIYNYIDINKFNIYNTILYRQMAPNIIVIDGSRPYFAVAERDYAISGGEATTIEELSDDTIAILEVIRIAQGPLEITLNNGKRYRYKYNDGPLNSSDSYYECDYNYLYTNYTDLFVDYNDTNNLFYVHDTAKPCLQYVALKSKNYPNRIKQSQIYSKALFCRYVDEYGNSVNRNDKYNKKYLKTYTVFILSSSITDSNNSYYTGYIDFTGLSTDDKYGIDSFTIYNDDIYLKKELDYLLSNQWYQAKWSDLIHYDGHINSDLSNYVYNRDYLNNTYPSSLYDNIYYKTILNNFDYKNYVFNLSKFDGYDTNINIKYDGLKYFYIHQKYNVGLNNFYGGNYYDKYQNYLPFMDINFLPYPASENCSVRKKIENYLPDSDATTVFSGLIKISGIYKNVDAYTGSYLSPKDYDLFWFNIPSGNSLKSALTINQGQVFYSNTLRIDDPLFSLVGTNYTSNYRSDNCRQTFLPSVNASNQTFPSVVFDFSHFNARPTGGSVFARFPVYCDTDRVNGCTSICGISTAGHYAFSGQYNMINQNSISLNSDDIPYIITHDNGIYNTIGNLQLHYIQRFELDPSNPLFPTNNCDSNIDPLPIGARNSCVNEKYQSVLANSIVSHDAVVANTDTIANEMLFRLMYGEKQKINLETIDGAKDFITFKDLMDYTDPKIEAKDVYRNIPYDLDINADSSNRKVSGTIIVKGTRNIGNNVTIKIADKTITVSIIRYSPPTLPNNIYIIMRARCEGKNYDQLLYTEQTQSTSYIATNGTLSGPNIGGLVSTCFQPGLAQYVTVSAYTNGTITYQYQGRDQTINFPYWPDDNSTCPEDRFYNGPDHPYLAFIHNPGCAPNVLPFTECTNRGAVNDPSVLLQNTNCTLVGGETYSVTVTDYARGVFSQGCVDVGGTVNINFVDDGGSLDDFGRGRITMDAGIVGSISSDTTPPCGTCFTLDYIDPVTGRDYYTVFKGQGSASNSCECRDWEYGYCRSTNNAAGCVCNALSYDYEEFDYSFEYCRYTISLKGFKKKLIYPPNIQSANYTLPICNEGDPITYPPGPSSSVSNVREFCGMARCQLQPSITWNVYSLVNTNTNPTYTAGNCSSVYCSVSYDNNNINLSLAGSNPFCIPVSIRNSCPALSVTVPDGNFTVSDTITSECDPCGVDSNKITLQTSGQDWEIVTETRTCVLGQYQLGGINSSFAKGIGRQVRSCQNCGGCDPNKCRTEVSVAGYGLCGKSAPDSFPWQTCISFGGNATACGNAVYGCDTNISVGSSYEAGFGAAEWREAMNIAYVNSAPCFSNISIDANNILEGMVGGSCSDLSFTTISIPATAYRASLGGRVQMAGTSISYEIAYYTYTYKRRRKIRDILRGTAGDSGDPCYTKDAQCINTAPKLKEDLSIPSCGTSVTCYNKDTLSPCAPTKYCCQAGKNESI